MKAHSEILTRFPSLSGYSASVFVPEPVAVRSIAAWL
jgi:hypothetical protein